MLKRQQTFKVMVGDVQIGHQNKIVIQSMTNTKTANVPSTVKQIKQLVNNGCELVRVAVLDNEDAAALNKIVKLSPCPIIADIHYNYRFAIQAIKSGVAKIRINPGNIALDNLKDVVLAAKKSNVAIRIGVNQGSKLNKEKPSSLQNMVDQAIKYIKQFEQWDFKKIIVSLKSSSPLHTIKLYELAANKIKYPLHLGVTEAGSKDNAVIKSAIGLSPLLQKGIGDTIRISVSGDPTIEPTIAKKILNNLNLYKNVPNVISCPTCGRLQWDLTKLLNQVESYCASINKQISIAIMGCNVNGVGECEHANVGVYGSKDKLFVYCHGKLIKTVSTKNGFNELIKTINRY